MSYKIEGRDIVFGGFEDGISDNPYEGINEMKGLNIISVPGEASVSYGTSLISYSSMTGSVISADSGTDIVTITTSTGDLQPNMAVVFSGGSLPTGITAGTTYWIAYVSSNQCYLFTNPFLSGSPVNITATGTGTVASINIGEIKNVDRTTGAVIDGNGRVWAYGGADSKYVFLGNSLPTSGGLTTLGQGIQWISQGDTANPKKGYLFIFMSSRMSYFGVTNYDNLFALTSATWVSEWDPATGASNPGTNTLNTPASSTTQHPSLYSSNDNIIYIGDGIYIDTLRKKATASTFDPTSTASYTWTSQALTIPTSDVVTCLAELGTSLLIGGKYNYVYPWDRISAGYSYPIVIAENYTYQMVTVNTNTYIFAGNRGRIYVTNGSQAQLYKKIPDHISGGIDPIYTWGGVGYFKNQIYFGMSCTTNAQVATSAYAGLWGIDITTNALRVVSIPTTSTAGITTFFAYPSTASGYGYHFSWKTSSSTYGIDSSVSQNPYTSYGPYIITELINVGQFLTKKTFENVEFKLAAPLVSGEGVRISYRTNLTESFTTLGETTTAGLISDVHNMNFENVQWVQFKIEQKGTTSGSYVRLRELRLR